MLNVGGRAVSPSSLAKGLDTLILASERSIDVGCLQINLRAHGATVRTRGWLFYPKYNAAYGAWYLADLHRRLGSWPAAVAAYHAGTNLDRGLAYCRRVAAALTSLNQVGNAELALTC